MSDAFPRSSYNVAAMKIEWVGGTETSKPLNLDGLTVVGFQCGTIVGTAFSFTIGTREQSGVSYQDSQKMLTGAGTYVPIDITPVVVVSDTASKIAPADTVALQFTKIVSNSVELASSEAYLLVRPAS